MAEMYLVSIGTQSQHFRTNKDREFPSSRGWKTKIKAVAGLAYSEAFPGLQMATLLMFLCVAILSLRCTNVSRPLLERTLIYLHWFFPRWCCFNLTLYRLLCMHKPTWTCWGVGVQQLWGGKGNTASPDTGREDKKAEGRIWLRSGHTPLRPTSLWRISSLWQTLAACPLFWGLVAGIDIVKAYSRQVRKWHILSFRKTDYKNSSLGAYWETTLSKLGSCDCFRLKSKQPHSC